MKIAFTSDIHVDISAENKIIVDYIIKELEIISPDVFILCGDISPKLDEISSTLCKFNALNCVKIFVPGNHDIWVDSKSKLKKGIDSAIKYSKLLPQVSNDNNFKYLVNAPIVINKIGLAGCMGWYDYSFRNCEFDDVVDKSEYRAGRHANDFWSDKEYAWWLRRPIEKDHEGRRILKLQTDDSVCTSMFEVLAHQLKELNKQNIDKIIVAMHFVPFKELIEYENILEKDFFAAYYGSNRISKILWSANNISHVLFGHVHKKIDRKIGNINAMSSPVGYWDIKNKLDLKHIAENSIKVINV